MSVCHDDASLPLVLCNLLQKEFSGPRTPVVGGIGTLGIAGIPASLPNRKGGSRGDEQEEEEG